MCHFSALMREFVRVEAIEVYRLYQCAGPAVWSPSQSVDPPTLLLMSNFVHHETVQYIKKKVCSRWPTLVSH